MAGYYRRAVLLAAAVALSCTFSITANASIVDVAGTASASVYPSNEMICFDCRADVLSFDLAVPISIEDREVVDRSRPFNRTHPLRERLSRGAVLPTAIAGWRSGRVKRLAAA